MIFHDFSCFWLAAAHLPKSGKDGGPTRGSASFSSERKVFDFISTAKSDVSNWYCIHAYFIEIQIRGKYGFFEFSSFFMLLDRF